MTAVYPILQPCEFNGRVQTPLQLKRKEISLLQCQRRLLQGMQRQRRDVRWIEEAGVSFLVRGGIGWLFTSVKLLHLVIVLR